MEQENNKSQQEEKKEIPFVEMDLTFKCGTPKLYAALRKAGYDIRTGARRKDSQPDKDSKDKQEP